MAAVTDRKRLYSPEVAGAILDALAEGRSLRSIWRDPGMPSEATARLWAVENVENFGDRMERARIAGCHALADEILEIADRAHDSDSAAAARVATENRRWLLSKLLPKTYGDKQQLEIGGSGAVIVGATGITRNPGDRLERPTIDAEADDA